MYSCTGVDSVAPKVTSKNTACRFFHATSSAGKVERGAPPTVSSRLLISALEKTSLPLPRSHRWTARDTGGLRLPHLRYVRRTLTTIIVLIKVADVLIKVADSAIIATVLHSEFLRKNARRYIQAAAGCYCSSLAGARRSGTFPLPLPEGLAPRTRGCYRLGFVVLCTDK